MWTSYYINKLLIYSNLHDEYLVLNKCSFNNFGQYYQLKFVFSSGSFCTTYFTVNKFICMQFEDFLTKLPHGSAIKNFETTNKN